MNSISETIGSRSRMAPEPHPVDVYVGSRIRLLRLSVGISAVELADRVGISFQQVGKYENGSDKVSASKLYAIATAFGVTVEFFFEGYCLDQPDDPAQRPEPVDSGLIDYGIVHQAEAVRLMRYYRRIPREGQRQAIMHLVWSLSSEDG